MIRTPIKFGIFAVILFFMIPASAMRVSQHVSQLRGLAHRGYAVMSKSDIARLLNNENFYPLEPERFAAEIANMPYDLDDLRALREVFIERVRLYNESDHWQASFEVDLELAWLMHKRNEANLLHIEFLFWDSALSLKEINDVNAKLRAARAKAAARNCEHTEKNQEPQKSDKKHD